MHNYLEIKSNIGNSIIGNQEETGNYQHYLFSKDYPIYTYRSDVFSYGELDQIITLGKRLNIYPATIGPQLDINNNIRISSVSWIGSTPSRSWLFERLTNYIVDQNKQFYKYDLDFIEHLQFTHYNSSQKSFYTKHTDPLLHNLPYNRKLSIVVQLSDPTTYEGGDLILYSGAQGQVVPKDRGLVHFFPSHCLHEVTPVTAGERYSLVGWVHGAPLK